MVNKWQKRDKIETTPISPHGGWGLIFFIGWAQLFEDWPKTFWFIKEKPRNNSLSSSSHFGPLPSSPMEGVGIDLFYSMSFYLNFSKMSTFWRLAHNFLIYKAKTVLPHLFERNLKGSWIFGPPNKIYIILNENIAYE